MNKFIRKIFHKNKKSKLFNVFGQNNKIDISDNVTIRGYIYGDNNTVIIEDSKEFGKHSPLSLFIGLPECPVNNCRVHIGKDFSSNGTMIRICEDNTELIIGDDCMFSDDICMWASDTHTITDIDGNIINVGSFIRIGNHVWLGHGASIMKNTCIGNNCIIGTHAVVSGDFSSNNCIIAGCPAKIVKNGVNWDRRRPKQYIIQRGIK